MSTSSVAGDSVAGISAARRPLLAALVVERRALLLCTVLVALGTAIWIVAITTDQWLIVNGGDGIFVPETRRYFVRSNAGLWRLCRSVLVPPTASPTPTPTPSTTTPAVTLTVTTPILPVTNSTPHTNVTAVPTPAPTPPLQLNASLAAAMTPMRRCRYHIMVVSTESSGARPDPALDAGIINYSRTELSFAVISLFVMLMGVGFSIYTFRNPRYTFKRLAAGIHFITVACTMVVLQVLISSVDYEKQNVSFIFPKGATHSFGYSFFLAWFVLLLNFCSGCCFLFYSRKRKGNKAATDELAMADEPTIIGR